MFDFGYFSKKEPDHQPFCERVLWFDLRPHFSFSRMGFFCALFLDIFQER